MESKRISLPPERGYDKAYELAYKLAGERLAKTVDIEEQCRKSGTELQVKASQKSIVVQYLNCPYLISFPDGAISPADSDELVPIRDKLLIIHYFNTAKGTPATSRLITFRELPEGNVYFPTFTKRTIKPIADNFSPQPRLLVTVGEKLGGHKVDYGDAAVTIQAFSRVPVTLILWRGDEELPPQGNVIFDANISDYLPTEDITVLCETITWRLIRCLRER
jgi:hypothetical protein